jgi:phage shock protein A
MLSSIWKALKGGVSEVGEAIVDNQAVRILEQEIREAQDAIGKAKQSLTNVKATEMKLNREVNHLRSEASDYEQKAIALLDKGDEAMAMEVAERIAELEGEAGEKEAEYNAVKSQVNELLKIIKQRDTVIAKNKRELEQVKTVSQIQKATSSISDNISATASSGNRVQKAMERVKAKQANWKDQMAAGAEMEVAFSGSDLDAKIKAAGVGDNAAVGSDILARLKAKQAK